MPLSPATVTRLEKVAVDNGFDQDLPRVGDWLGFSSTLAPLRVWLSYFGDAVYLAAFSQLNVARAPRTTGDRRASGSAGPARAEPAAERGPEHCGAGQSIAATIAWTSVPGSSSRTSVRPHSSTSDTSESGEGSASIERREFELE